MSPKKWQDTVFWQNPKFRKKGVHDHSRTTILSRMVVAFAFLAVVGRSGRRCGASWGGLGREGAERALWGVLGGFSVAWKRSGWVWILFFPLESLHRLALAGWRWLGFEESFVAVAASRRQRTPTARSAWVACRDRFGWRLLGCFVFAAQRRQKTAAGRPLSVARRSGSVRPSGGWVSRARARVSSFLFSLF